MAFAGMVATLILASVLVTVVMSALRHNGCTPGKWGLRCERDCTCPNSKRVCGCHTNNGTLCDMLCVSNALYVADSNTHYTLGMALASLSLLSFAILTGITVWVYQAARLEKAPALPEEEPEPIPEEKRTSHIILQIATDPETSSATDVFDIQGQLVKDPAIIEQALLASQTSRQLSASASPGEEETTTSLTEATGEETTSTVVGEGENEGEGKGEGEGEGEGEAEGGEGEGEGGREGAGEGEGEDNNATGPVPA